MRPINGSAVPARVAGSNSGIGVWRGGLHGDVSGSRRPRGLTLFDTLLVCVLVSVLIGAFMNYYDRTVRKARETALQTGLANIRLSVQLFRAVNGRYPGDLKELLRSKLLMPTREGSLLDQEYLRAQALDAGGNPVDPFGWRYRYEPAGGRVSSATAGYEEW